MKLMKILIPIVAGAMLFCSYGDGSVTKKSNYIINGDSVFLTKTISTSDQNSFFADTLIVKKPDGKKLAYIDISGDRDLDQFRIFEGGGWTDYSDEASTMYWAQMDYLEYLSKVDSLEGKLN